MLKPTLVAKFKLTSKLVKVNETSFQKIQENNLRSVPLFLTEAGEYILLMHWHPGRETIWLSNQEHVEGKESIERLTATSKCLGVAACYGTKVPSNIIKKKMLSTLFVPEYFGTIKVSINSKDELCIYLDNHDDPFKYDTVVTEVSELKRLLVNQIRSL